MPGSGILLYENSVRNLQAYGLDDSESDKSFDLRLCRVSWLIVEPTEKGSSCILNHLVEFLATVWVGISEQFS